MRAIMRSTPLCLLFTLLLASAAHAQADAAPVTDVRNILARGFLIEDRNGDDVVDFVRGRILLAAEPTTAEAVAAANVAARLGYETSALDLGLVARSAAGFDVPVIVIGETATPAGITDSGVWGGALAAGEGMVGFVTAGGTLRAGGVLLDGGDATGLGAAAAYLSGRYPAIWTLDGSGLDDVPDRIRRFLEQRDVSVETTTLDRVVVDAMRPGVSRALVTVRVVDGSTYATAVEALGADAASDSSTAPAGAGAPADSARGGAAGRAGSQAGERPVRRRDLDIRDLHRIDVRVVSPDSARIVRLLPARAWRTEAGDPFNAREAPDFTLSDLYTIDGLFRDTNQDLVPDRTDAYLSVDGAIDAEGLVDLAARVGLETAGMRLPFAHVAGQDDHPETRGFPILYVSGHYRTERLREAGVLYAGGEATGEGSIEM
jgi:hypothetical protein